MVSNIEELRTIKQYRTREWRGTACVVVALACTGARDDDPTLLLRRPVPPAVPAATMMRHAVAVLVHLFAILLAPYWAHFCTPAEDGGHCVAGYASASAYTLITLLLFHVQQDREDCLAETGLDDVFFVPEELDAHLLGGEGLSLLVAEASSRDAQGEVGAEGWLSER